MDYYQGVVADYLSADRAIFVKPECLICLNRDGPLAKGEHWYCDVLAVNFRGQPAVYLCEFSFSQTLGALSTRFRERSEHWQAVRPSICRDNCLPDWPVRPCAFVRGDCRSIVSREVVEFLSPNDGPDQMPKPLVTALEDVAPWLYSSPHELPGDRESDA